MYFGDTWEVLLWCECCLASNVVYGKKTDNFGHLMHSETTKIMSAMNIKAKLGKVIANVKIDEKLGLDSNDIIQALEFNDEQFLYIEVRGLKDTVTGNVLVMDDDEFMLDSTSLSPEQLRELVDGRTYELIFHGRTTMFTVLLS